MNSANENVGMDYFFYPKTVFCSNSRTKSQRTSYTKILSSASRKDRNKPLNSQALYFNILSLIDCPLNKYMLRITIINPAVLCGMIHQSIQITFSHFTVTADKDSYSKDYCN